MSDSAWYKPELDVSTDMRRYMRKTGKNPQTIDDEGPYQVLSVSGFGHMAAITIGWDLRSLGFVGWHYIGIDKYRPGPPPKTD